MTTNVHCYVPILGKRIRVTQMNDDGTTGLSYIATDGFISVTLSAQIEAGVEILQRNAAGVLCVNEKLASNFKRFNVDIEFCGVNPALASYVANGNPYADYAGDTAGMTISEGIIDGAFALEIWTGVGGAVNDEHANGYFLLPFVHRGNLEDMKIDGSNAVTFGLKGGYTLGGNAWGVGPYNVVSSNDSPSGTAVKLPTALDPFDHFLMIDTAIAPPAAACNPTLVTAG